MELPNWPSQALLGVMGAPVSPLFPAPPLCISGRPLPSFCTTFIFYSLAVFVEPVFPPRTYSTLSAVRNTPLGLAQGFPRGYDGKEYSRDAGDLVSVPGSGISPAGGHGNPLQYPCLENF